MLENLRAGDLAEIEFRGIYLEFGRLGQYSGVQETRESDRQKYPREFHELIKQQNSCR